MCFSKGDGISKMHARPVRCFNRRLVIDRFVNGHDEGIPANSFSRVKSEFHLAYSLIVI